MNNSLSHNTTTHHNRSTMGDIFAIRGDMCYDNKIMMLSSSGNGGYHSMPQDRNGTAAMVGRPPPPRAVSPTAAPIPLAVPTTYHPTAITGSANSATSAAIKIGATNSYAAMKSHDHDATGNVIVGVVGSGATAQTTLPLSSSSSSSMSSPPMVAVVVPPPTSTKVNRFQRLLRRGVRTTTAIDLVIIIFVVLALLLVEFGWIPHNERLGFVCHAPHISYPYRGDTITATTLVLSLIGGTFMVLVFAEACRQKSWHRISRRTIAQQYQVWFLGFVFVLLLVEVTKVIVGEHRPHFLDSCQPDVVLQNKCPPGALTTRYNCTNAQLSKRFLSDLSKSFPSGHAAVSVFTAVFCAYLFEYRVPSDHVTKLTKPLVLCICISWALLCSLSRITDRRHHWWDVLAGAVIGTIGAIYCIKRVYVIRTPTSEKQPFNGHESIANLYDVKNKDATSIMV